MFENGDKMKMKYLILFIPLILVLIFDYWFLFLREKEIIIEEPLIDNEPICTKNCKEGDKIKLVDGSSWHILKINENKLTLFSDANIDLEGKYLPLDTFSTENTGVPVAFDKVNERLTQNNPYCIFPDIGCSAYEKNGLDVFEDSSIKKIIDTKFLPIITKTLNTDNIVVRLMKQEEFEYFKNLEVINNTSHKWLYYSGYWLMTSYNNYSVFVHKENTDDLSVIAASISYGYGIRPVIEMDYDIIL